MLISQLWNKESYAQNLAAGGPLSAKDLISFTIPTNSGQVIPNSEPG